MNGGSIAERSSICVDGQRCRLREDATALHADAYLFATPEGQPIHPQLLSNALRRLVQTSGLPYIRFRDLRHTHATLLLKAGVPIKVVSERLGHSTPGFTMATYQHALPGMQAGAAELFGKLLCAPPTSTASTRWKSRWRHPYAARPSQREGL